MVSLLEGDMYFPSAFEAGRLSSITLHAPQDSIHSLYHRHMVFEAGVHGEGQSVILNAQ